MVVVFIGPRGVGVRVSCVMWCIRVVTRARRDVVLESNLAAVSKSHVGWDGRRSVHVLSMWASGT